MRNKYIISKVFALLIVLQFAIFNSCTKFTDVAAPTDQLSSDLVYEDSSAAIGAVTGIYSEMLNSLNLFSNSATTLYGGLSADELYFYSPSTKDEFVKNQITLNNHFTIDNAFWKPAYKYIYTANLAIERLAESKKLSMALKNQLTGEAKFIRAFCYFSLVNLFGDVPLITSSKYQNSANSSRTPSSEIYTQIIKDLNDAKSLLTAQYPSAEKVRPNTWTAAALLARSYLYTNRWSEAETEANAIISSGRYSLEPNLNSVYLKNSSEAIWQMIPVRPGFNTYEGREILPATNFSAPTYLITLVMRNSFENGDSRKIAWVKSRVFNSDTLYYPNKYKLPNGATISEYYMVFRLAEQYLIRAEARLNQNKFPEAQSDINVIRNRSGLPNTTALTASLLKQSIEQERRVELFSEWGHRWFDLKRTGRANEVLSAFKGASWQPTDILWPIPQPEINLNPALIQNSGY